MKKLLSILLIICTLIAFTSCDIILPYLIEDYQPDAGIGVPSPDGGKTDGGDDTADKPTTPDTDDVTPPKDDPNGDNTGDGTTDGDNTEKPDNDFPVRYYSEFTGDESCAFIERFGLVIPFIENDEYYVDVLSLEADGFDGINYYTYGNTQPEFESYLELYSDYEHTDTYYDDYGDAWYCYEKNGILVEVSYYVYEGEACVDIYVSVISEEDYLNSITPEAKVAQWLESYDCITIDEALALAFDHVSAPSGKYYYVIGTITYVIDELEGQVYVEDSTGEIFVYGIKGSDGITKYEELGIELEVGDTVLLRGKLRNYEGYLPEIQNARLIDYCRGSRDTDVDTEPENGLITNEGVGLPEGENGVYTVDFTKARIKNVTEQDTYIDGCPTTGSPAVLVIPVEFSDVSAASKGYTTDVLVNAFAKDGKTDYYSVYDYYYISSYGELTLDVTVLDFWFKPQYSSEYYRNATDYVLGYSVEIGDQLILDEALEYLSGIMDLSDFDSDNNGTIDSVILINTLDIDPDENFYWAYRYWNVYTNIFGDYYEYDGVYANDYMWASYQFLHESTDWLGNTTYTNTSGMSTYTYIHEFGHVLGADDYYDTSYTEHPMEGYDVMDSLPGDHNPYTKFNFGWITESRIVVTDGSVTLDLCAFDESGDTIILANNWDAELGAYQEYYVIMYYTRTGLNSGDNGYFFYNGIVVYHVNASLYKDEYDGEPIYDVHNNNDHPTSEYGTEDNLIELVKNPSGTFLNGYVFTKGSSLPALTDDNGNALGYTFTVDSLSESSATITFTKVG